MTTLTTPSMTFGTSPKSRGLGRRLWAALERLGARRAAAQMYRLALLDAVNRDLSLRLRDASRDLSNK